MSSDIFKALPTCRYQRNIAKNLASFDNMIKSSLDTMEKRLTNKNLTLLSEATARCADTVGIDDDLVFATARSVLKHRSNPSDNESDSAMVRDYKKISKLPSVLGAMPHVVVKWTVYTKDRMETRRELLEAGFDVRNVDIIDGN